MSSLLLLLLSHAVVIQQQQAMAAMYNFSLFTSVFISLIKTT
jgi:hypothetical protein